MSRFNEPKWGWMDVLVLFVFLVVIPVMGATG